MNKNFAVKGNESQTEKDQSFEKLYSQVGGHVSMKILNERFVCKPLNLREVSFYQNLPADLSAFGPTYHGTGSLDSDSQLRFVTVILLIVFSSVIRSCSKISATITIIFRFQ